MDISRNEDEHVRRLVHEFTVQSLLFAFDSLEWLGYKPSSDGHRFWVGDQEGNPIDPSSDSSELDSLAGVLRDLIKMAPLAVDAMYKRGTPGEAGTDAGGALLEAWDRWTERRED